MINVFQFISEHADLSPDDVEIIQRLNADLTGK